MPVGAIIGGAAITAGGAVASGAMSSSAQKKAASKAADTSLATANANNALYKDIYGQNKALLTPFASNGLSASNALNDLLLGTHTYDPNATSAGALSSYGANPWDSYLANNPDLANEARRVTADGEFATPEDYAQWHFNTYGRAEGRADPTAVQPTPASASSGSTSNGALNAFDQFKQGTNYQWRLSEGQKALDSNLAAHSSLDSGAAEKAAIKYGQNFASGELSNYMNLLASQQAMGLSAAGAVAGVGTTYAGNVAASNTNASNTAANAALVSGQSSANMWGTVGNTAGQLGGALFQYGLNQTNSVPAFSVPSFASSGSYIPPATTSVLSSPSVMPTAPTWSSFG